MNNGYGNNGYGYTVPQSKPGGGRDLIALVFGLVALFGSTVLGPLAAVSGGVGVYFLLRYRKAGGTWGWTSSIGLASSLLGILFGLFVTGLLAVVLIRQDPASIYGVFIR